ncbi:MAG: hypothetical protein ACK6CT_07235 [Planctomycetia bacterium]
MHDAAAAVAALLTPASAGQRVVVIDVTPQLQQLREQLAANAAAHVAAAADVPRMASAAALDTADATAHADDAAAALTIARATLDTLRQDRDRMRVDARRIIARVGIAHQCWLFTSGDRAWTGSWWHTSAGAPSTTTAAPTPQSRVVGAATTSELQQQQQQQQQQRTAAASKTSAGGCLPNVTCSVCTFVPVVDASDIDAATLGVSTPLRRALPAATNGCRAMASWLAASRQQRDESGSGRRRCTPLAALSARMRKQCTHITYDGFQSRYHILV